MRQVKIARVLLGAGLACGARLAAQSSPPLENILSRLERLEQENRSLRQQVAELRAEVDGLRAAHDGVENQHNAPPAEERLAIQEARIQEHEQVKVGSSQRFPLRITGMALFNVFGNGRYADHADQPLVAGRYAEDRAWGGSLRQSILGLAYDGPTLLGGGKVSGSLAMDFYGGSGQSLDSVFRIRTGSIRIDWKHRSLLVGQEKPLFAPRNPTSYAQVGVPALSAAGNLWRWQPQVRFEQRLALGTTSGLRAQLGLIQTSEDMSSADPAEVYPTNTTVPSTAAGYASNALLDEHRRPGFEGRFELWHRFDDTRRLEIAPGFHVSTSHVLGTSLPSNLFSLDWFVNPWARLEFSGAFYTGQNVNHFGSANPGFTLLRANQVVPVHSRGGWSQISLLATNRLSFNVYGGEQDDRQRDLVWAGAGLNRAGAANLIYRIAPNVVFSLEAMQIRTTYVGLGRRLNNHYDLAVAYLF